MVRETMITQNAEFVRKEISRGVKAHKAGDNKMAWLHFQAALREDADHVTALLWLAYLSDDYEKRIFLLKRVLEIDPNNDRAKAGLAWARQQQGDDSTTAATADTTSEDAVTPEDVTLISQKLKSASGTDDLKTQALKGTIAQRARRRISPL
jgi:Tfp pilus assembly protein PilF